MKSHDLVVLSSRWEHQLYEDFYDLENSTKSRKLFSNNGTQITHEQALKIFEDKLSEIAEKLQTKNIKLIIFAPIPVFRGIEDPVLSWACAKEWFRPFTDKTCKSNYREEKKNINKRNISIKNTFVRIKSKYDNANIYDPFDLLCPSNVLCTSFLKKTMIYRDNDHLSRDGSIYLYKDFTEFLYSNNLLRSK